MTDSPVFDKKEKSYFDGIQNYFPLGTWNSKQNGLKMDEIIKTQFENTIINHKKITCLINIYSNSFQIWNLNNPKFPIEVTTKKDVSVNFITFLPEPEKSTEDAFLKYRPILVMVPNEPESKSSKVKLYSIKTGGFLHEFKFHSQIFSVSCNKTVLLVSLVDQIFGFHPETLEKTIHTGCFPLTSSTSVALGSRWFAYPGNSLAGAQNSERTYSKGYTELGVDVAKKALSGITYLGDLGAKVVSNYVNPEGIDTSKTEEEEEKDQTHAGIVVIKDIKTNKVVAHFKAHTQQISFMKFDPSGTLLVTSSIEGNYLNLYHIMPSIDEDVNGRSFRQIYRLYRGLTSATIRDVQFSVNSKWLVVSSAHGTSHIYAINPTGGVVNYITHSRLIPFPSQIVRPEDALYHSKVQEEIKQETISISVLDRIHNNIYEEESEVKPSLYGCEICTKFVENQKISVDESLLVALNTGEIKQFLLKPLQGKTEINSLDIKIEVTEQYELSPDTQFEKKNLPLTEFMPKQQEIDLESKWISMIEIDTYTTLKQPLWSQKNFKFRTYTENQSDKEDDLTQSLIIKKSQPIPLNLIKNDKNDGPMIQESIIKAIYTPLKKTEKKEFFSTSLGSPREENSSDYIHKPPYHDLVNHDEILINSTSKPTNVIFDEPMLDESLILEEIKANTVDNSKEKYQNYFNDLSESYEENQFSSLQNALKNQKNVNSFEMDQEEENSTDSSKKEKVEKKSETKQEEKVEKLPIPKIEEEEEENGSLFNEKESKNDMKSSINKNESIHEKLDDLKLSTTNEEETKKSIDEKSNGPVKYKTELKDQISNDKDVMIKSVDKIEIPSDDDYFSKVNENKKYDNYFDDDLDELEDYVEDEEEE